MVDRAAVLKANRLNGSEFEAVFTRVCRLQGFAVRKNPISGEYKWDGTFRPVASELDFTLVDNQRISFFDTKSVQDTSFALSLLPAHQVKTAVWFNDLGITAGFVVWFKPRNRIVFFSGHKIAAKGDRGSFSDEEGLLIGQFEHFEIRRTYL